MKLHGLYGISTWESWWDLTLGAVGIFSPPFHPAAALKHPVVATMAVAHKTPVSTKPPTSKGTLLSTSRMSFSVAVAQEAVRRGGSAKAISRLPSRFHILTCARQQLLQALPFRELQLQHPTPAIVVSECMLLRFERMDRHTIFFCSLRISAIFLRPLNFTPATWGGLWQEGRGATAKWDWGAVSCIGCKNHFLRWSCP